MPRSELSPISVVQYSRDFLIELIRYKTGWDQRNEVSDKTQLTYLCNYLEVDHISTKTIVVENEYVDRHYLEDYTEYYARCFAAHARKCTRVHFFSNSFNEHEFTDALTTNDKKFIKALSSNYVGFAVIRPIPHTFLAKVCIKPYNALVSSDGYTLITKEHRVSLFGLSLKVQTAAFLEQDKVVSACATSALWMLYSSFFQKPYEYLPSPSAITKSASLPDIQGGRTFPTKGLSPIQVAKSLKHFELEPIIISYEFDGDFSGLKELLYGYISNDIPVIIGGDIYQTANEKKAKHVGKHLVCALGFHLRSTQRNKKTIFKLRSHTIDKIYVHDDRYGPYVRIDADPIDISDKKQKRHGLALCLKKYNSDGSETIDKLEYFVPDVIIIGLYHKIRVSYSDLRDMCTALHYYLSVMFERIKKVSETIHNDPDQKEYYKAVGSILNVAVSGEWDISLTTNTAIKTELRASKGFESFNGETSMETLLLLSMPRYIWRCRIWTSDNRPKLISDILFDATEVPQGHVFIGYVSYSQKAEFLWKHVEQNAYNRAWIPYNLPDKVRDDLSYLWKFFSKSNEKTYLNTLYGPIGLPRRKLKGGEADDYHNIGLRSDINIIRKGSNINVELNKDINYIWVINENGDLVIGQDIADHTIDKYQGHPTLIDGKPARLGGELIWSKTSHRWFINLKSRTYSEHISVDSPREKQFLANVIEHNFKSIDPTPVPKSHVVT